VTVAVLVNAHARHGSEALGARIRNILPEARVAVTRSLEQARDFLREELSLRPPSVLLSGGGDGTAVSLLNTLREERLPIPALGLLPLGTGNGWARATGSVGPRAALRSLAALEGGAAPTVRPFGLVEAEGRVTPFAGMGWDAEILADYKRMVDETSAPVDPNAPPGARSGQKRGSAMLPYLRSMFTRSIPRLLTTERPRVRLVNLGEDALVVDPSGRVVFPLGGVDGFLRGGRVRADRSLPDSAAHGAGGGCDQPQCSARTGDCLSGGQSGQRCGNRRQPRGT